MHTAISGALSEQYHECSKTVLGCSSAWKSKTLSLIAVLGRMFSSFQKEEWAAARHSKAGPPQSICSSRLAFELMDVAAVDGDLPRLHGLGNLPNQKYAGTKPQPMLRPSTYWIACQTKVSWAASCSTCRYPEWTAPPFRRS